MFSFRRDKVGFFFGLGLIVLLVGTGLVTLLLLIVGGWDSYSILLRVIWGTSWVLCIVLVFVRVQLFRWKMKRQQQSD